MAKNQCGYCQCEISSFRLRCSVCSDFDLCLQCFSCGAETVSHKKEHDYKILVEGTSSVFDVSNSPWTSAEETMLLDAVEQYGIGNWDDVASHVESRTTTDCFEHYTMFFIQGNIGRATFPLEISTKITDHTCPIGGPLSPSLSSPFPPVEIALQEQRDLGYMPLRDDFELECENEVEALISSLSSDDNDAELDIAVKLSQVDNYRMKLREREKRKRIARDYGLIAAAAAAAAAAGNKLKPPQPKRKFAKDEKEFQEKMRTFTQFQSSAEHDRFFENLQKEKDVKSRIKELLRFRKNGLTKLEEIEEFEDDKYCRERKRGAIKKKTGSVLLAKRTSMVSKKAEEKLDIVIAPEAADVKDDIVDMEEARELSAMPGYQMLSDRERKLCSSIGMTPANYITIKTCIIKDYLQRRQGYPVKIRYPSGLDKTHRRKIMSFLTDNGWIGVT